MRPGPTSTRRSWLTRGALLAMAVIAAGGLGWRFLRAPTLPIPVPAQLGALDPQVRDHLKQLAFRVADAPRDPDRRAELGLAFAVNGLWGEARQCFLDAVRCGARGPLPPLYAAVAQQELGDEAAAGRELKEVLRAHPRYAPAWHRLGTWALMTGNLPEARAAFEEVTRLAPGEWRGWAGLGDARLRSGQAADAVPALERARALDPTARNVHYLLGQAYRAVGKVAEAERAVAVGKAQTLTPMPDEWSVPALEHMKALPDQFERAEGLVERGQAAEAIGRLREALRFHPTNVAVVVELVRAMNAGEQSEGAWGLLQPLLARQPEDVTLLTAAATTVAMLGQTNEAVALAERAVALAPQSAEARLAVANAALAGGRDAAAAEALAKAVQLAPWNVELLVQLGDLQRQNLGEPKLAEESYRTVLQRDPLHAGARQRLFEQYLAHGDRGGARQLIEDLRAIVPESQGLRQLEARFHKVFP